MITINLLKLLLRYYYNKFNNRQAKIYSLYVSTRANLLKGSRINGGVIIGEGVQLGEYSYINDNSVVINTHIGNFSSISYNCMIGLPNHPVNYVTTSPSLYSKDNIFQNSKSYFNDQAKTIIGNDVWIGVNTTILQGLKIGHGAIIGAGSIVTKDIPPYAIAVGNPARVIKYRFSEEKIKFLLDYKFWEKYDDSKERKYIRKLVEAKESWFYEI